MNDLPNITNICLDEIKTITDIFRKNNFQLFLVGGCTRDFLLHRKINDWDMTTDATPDQMKIMFNDINVKIIETGIKHGTLTVMINNIGFEITTFRTELGFSDNRHPDKVKFVSHLFEDLQRRDFTINAIAFDLIHNCWSDNEISNQGLEDLNNKIIRAVGDPKKRFEEDALRILRAIRFSCQLNFEIDFETIFAIKRSKILIKNISIERIISELNKIFKSNNTFDGLWFIFSSKILDWLIPEFVDTFNCDQNNVNHRFTVGEHTLRSIIFLDEQHQTENIFIAKWAIFFHDIGKSVVKTTDERGDHFINHQSKSFDLSIEVMKRLRFPNDMVKRISTLVLHHDDISNKDQIKKHHVKRLLQNLGKGFNENGMLDQFIWVRHADISSQNFTEEKEKQLETFCALAEEVISNKDPLFISDLDITGKDVMDTLNIKGERIGIILDRCLSHVIKRPSDNKREILIKLLKGFNND